jgi:hypothetical protein
LDFRYKTMAERLGQGLSLLHSPKVSIPDRTKDRYIYLPPYTKSENKLVVYSVK